MRGGPPSALAPGPGLPWRTSTHPTSEPDPPTHGRLLPADGAPATGERTEVVLARPSLVIEQILSGRVDTRLDYLQDHDEWVVVLCGAAVLDVGGTPVALRPFDWAFLPAGVAHSLLQVDPGTNWLAVHVSPGSGPPPPPAPAPR